LSLCKQGTSLKNVIPASAGMTRGGLDPCYLLKLALAPAYAGIGFGRCRHKFRRDDDVGRSCTIFYVLDRILA